MPKLIVVEPISDLILLVSTIKSILYCVLVTNKLARSLYNEKYRASDRIYLEKNSIDLVLTNTTTTCS